MAYFRPVIPNGAVSHPTPRNPALYDYQMGFANPADFPEDTISEEGEEKQFAQHLEEPERGQTDPTSTALIHEKSSFFDLLSGEVSDRVLQLVKRQLAASVDADVCYTYRKGLHDHDDPSAPQVNIDVHYVQGSDDAAMNSQENGDLNCDNVIHKPPTWLTLTAGDLLLEPRVQENLKIVYTDITSDVLAKHFAQNRPKVNMTGLGEATRSLSLNNKNTGDAVNIHSKRVRLVNKFSPQQPAALRCTCIEVDYMSLLQLIANFRQLIESRGKFNPLSAEDMTKILGTMIEDARRLLVRSPILSRVANRIDIIQSENTRYGFDNGTMFHTFTTSKGIAEIISLSQGYYVALEQKSIVAQKAIRPKFLQMLVFLLSLINDKDLPRLRPALEASFDLKADRASLELTILKVIPSIAVGPLNFLSGVLSAYESRVVQSRDSLEHQKEQWQIFLGRIASEGWILPAWSDRLSSSSKPGTWRVKWDKFKDTSIFDNLQLTHEKSTVNLIPSLKIRGDEMANQEVSAEFCNGRTYTLEVKHLDSITLAVPNNYIIHDPRTRQSYDLVVDEIPLDKDIHEAALHLNRICAVVNKYVQNPDRKLDRRASIFKRQSSRSDARLEFRTVKPSGRLTMNTTTLVNPGTPGGRPRSEPLAVTWKLDGRKITYKHLVSVMNVDIAAINETLSQLEGEAEVQRKRGVRGLEQEHDFADLATNLESVRRSCDRATLQRRSIQSASRGGDDEPIVRVHFPDQVHGLQETPFEDYTQSLVPDDTQLTVVAKRYTVAAPPAWDPSGLAQLNLQCTNAAGAPAGPGPTVTVMPLEPGLDEADCSMEVRKGNEVLLMGGYLVVVKPVAGSDPVKPIVMGHKVKNYMKVTALSTKRKHRRRRSGSDDSDDDEDDRGVGKRTVLI